MSNNDEQKPGGFDWRSITPQDSPKTPLDIRADAKHVDLSSAKLATGDVAFDFTREVFDYSTGVARITGEVLQLAEQCREKPVALIFGSYT